MQSDMELIRKRPGMYVGPIEDGTGLHRMVFEVVDNGVAEMLRGHADLVVTSLESDGSVSVWDNGRGIPVDILPQEGISAAELIMTRLHAGGRFDRDVYQIFGGLPVVGVSVVNALSETLKLRIWRNGVEWFMRFRDGEPIAPLNSIGPARDRTGTEIRFLPSRDIFPGADFNTDLIEDHVRQLPPFSHGRFSLIDKRGTKPRQIDVGET